MQPEILAHSPLPTALLQWRHMGRAALAALSLSVVVAAFQPPGSAQSRLRPDPDTYHWVLPTHLPGVDVALLHPNDCYAVQEARGTAYFGELLPALAELQRQLTRPYVHLVDSRTPHVECQAPACVRVAALTAAIGRELARLDQPRLLRGVNHRPSPVDAWFGGAYTDVGSEDRRTYRDTPEQQMVFRHLGASSRGNCYEAKAPRTLSIHVRDQEIDRSRAGVYSGFLYIEHHHPVTVGEQIAGE